MHLNAIYRSLLLKLVVYQTMSSIRSIPKKSFMTNVLLFKQTLFSPAPCMHDKTLSVNSQILKQEKNFGYAEVRKA